MGNWKIFVCVYKNLLNRWGNVPRRKNKNQQGVYGIISLYQLRCFSFSDEPSMKRGLTISLCSRALGSLGTKVALRKNTIPLLLVQPLLPLLDPRIPRLSPLHIRWWVILLFPHNYALPMAALAFLTLSLLHALPTAVLISEAGLVMSAHLARYGLAAAD